MCLYIYIYMYICVYIYMYICYIYIYIARILGVTALGLPVSPTGGFRLFGLPCLACWPALLIDVFAILTYHKAPHKGI